MPRAGSPLRGPPSDHGKRSYVREMFTAIAPRYDLLNHALSLNMDWLWRRSAVRKLGWEAAPQGAYLDLCAGTLDLAAELARRPGFGGSVVGADFVVPMLQHGRRKASSVYPVAADALSLPFANGSFDGCTVAFGIRNLADVNAGLTEMARVLKPGGRLVVLEFSIPLTWPLRPLYLFYFYFRTILPVIGRTVSKHMTAYSYLPDSVERFPDNEGFAALMQEGGFTHVGVERLTSGVASLYWGEVGDHR
ncbi:MAG: ubiquinone/menaquinone biosynthesis methyltransferase [Gemmatimonadota bacterium]|nr:MAG: ubiquinone/menaquinone biosynthesis methyltransferase [Gemmatimonadota bacterium]